MDCFDQLPLLKSIVVVGVELSHSGNKKLLDKSVVTLGELPRVPTKPMMNNNVVDFGIRTKAFHFVDPR